MKRLLRLDWDIIAGITAAVLAVILHLLHVVETDVLLTITLVLLALLLFRDLRRESLDERLAETLHAASDTVQDIQSKLQPADAILVGPRHLRTESRRFAESSHGEMIWFNVCCQMFKTQDVFDLMLRPAIENPRVSAIQFICSEDERRLWHENLVPKVQECAGRDKVREPLWRDLPQTTSFILADMEPAGATEALLSFWGEPFMSRATGRQVPRYIFRVQRQSDLVSRLVELERQYRLGDS